MTPEALHEAMSEIGPLLELAEVCAFPDEQLWTLVFDEDEVVEVELDDEQQRVMLAINVCDLSPDDVARHCQTLLQVNLLWRQTGGVRFALAEETVVEMLELPLAAAELSSIVAAVTGLRDSAAQWRAFLLADPSEAGPPPDTVDASAIRV